MSEAEQKRAKKVTAEKKNCHQICIGYGDRHDNRNTH